MNICYHYLIRLKTRGFNAYVCENVEQANKVVENIIDECTSINSIGFGNSITLKSMGLHEILEKYTKNIYIHTPIGTENTDRMALTADCLFNLGKCYFA